MSVPQRYGNFDANFCGRIAKICASICVALLICTIAIVVVVDPSNTKCPGWLVTRPHEAPATIYGFIAMQAFAAAAICFHAFRWEHFSNRVRAQIKWAENELMTNQGDLRSGSNRFLARCAVENNFNVIFPVVSIGWIAFCCIPLGFLAFRCA